MVVSREWYLFTNMVHVSDVPESTDYPGFTFHDILINTKKNLTKCSG